jgi:cytochrome b pre-mRNA-processing protein 3
MFGIFKQRINRKRQARALYESCVGQARLPVFYQELGVPDTVDGRFEMVALHCFMTISRLNKAGDARLGQALFDVFFVNMDRSLREMGVGDLGVPKHMKRMMQGFNGRRLNYEKALETHDGIALKDVLKRNVYGTVDTPKDENIAHLATYIQASYHMEQMADGAVTVGFAPIDFVTMEVRRA